MAYTTINKSSDNFNTILNTGNGSTQNITNVGFQPDLVWAKRRNTGGNHQWYDAVRGATYTIWSDGNWAQASYTDGLTSFDSDGFTAGGNGDLNASGGTYAYWNWKAGNSTGSTNNDGSVTSTVSANTTAGFSICKFTFPSSGNFTFGHGLGVAPKMFILKGYTATANWQVYNESLGNTYNTQLNVSSASNTAANWWGSTSPTSTVCTVGADLVESGQTAIAYCFAEKTGYSKFGKYSGNSNADGSFIYLGFKPSFIMVKRTDTGNSYDNWIIYDNKRSGYNPDNDRLHADITDAENNDNTIDIVSNGFKIRSNNSNLNGGTHIYMAFGQSLVGSNNVPCTAR